MHFQNSKHFLIPVHVDRKLTYSIHIKVAYSKFFFLRFRYVVDKSLMFTCNGGWGNIQILEKKKQPKNGGPQFLPYKRTREQSFMQEP